MAVNERIQYDINDIPFEQLAPSKAGQTNFTPGKADARPDDQNWPQEFRIPTGNRSFDSNSESENGPVEVTRVRIVKLGRNIIADEEIQEPIVLRTVVTSIKDAANGICGTSTVTETLTRDVFDVERFREGYDWAEGAT
jgi:hypothetical protein